MYIMEREQIDIRTFPEYIKWVDEVLADDPLLLRHRFSGEPNSLGATEYISDHLIGSGFRLYCDSNKRQPILRALDGADFKWYGKTVKENHLNVKFLNDMQELNRGVPPYISNPDGHLDLFVEYVENSDIPEHTRAIGDSYKFGLATSGLSSPLCRQWRWHMVNEDYKLEPTKSIIKNARTFYLENIPGIEDMTAFDTLGREVSYSRWLEGGYHGDEVYTYMDARIAVDQGKKILDGLVEGDIPAILTNGYGRNIVAYNNLEGIK